MFWLRNLTSQKTRSERGLGTVNGTRNHQKYSLWGSWKRNLQKKSMFLLIVCAKLHSRHGGGSISALSTHPLKIKKTIPKFTNSGSLGMYFPLKKAYWKKLDQKYTKHGSQRILFPSVRPRIVVVVGLMWAPKTHNARHRPPRLRILSECMPQWLQKH